MDTSLKSDHETPLQITSQLKGKTVKMWLESLENIDMTKLTNDWMVMCCKQYMEKFTASFSDSDAKTPWKQTSPLAS